MPTIDEKRPADGQLRAANPASNARRREYLNRYNRKWLRNRRKAWFASNGPCKSCGSRRRLQVHHLDRSTKVSHNVWSWREERRIAELAKCIILCYRCHLAETKKQLAVPAPEGMAWCNFSKHFQPLTEFHKNRAKPHGRQEQCKACRRIEKRNRDERRRQQ